MRSIRLREFVLLLTVFPGAVYAVLRLVPRLGKADDLRLFGGALLAVLILAGWQQSWALVVPACACMVPVTVVLATRAANRRSSLRQRVRAFAGLLTSMETPLVVVLALPVLEESVYRLALFRLGSDTGWVVWQCATVSALAFGVGHLVALGPRSWPVCLLGMTIAVTYAITTDFAIAVIAHIVWNLAVYLVRAGGARYESPAAEIG